MSKSLEIAKQLIACKSVTPDDAGCQEIIANYLTQMNFHLETLPFGKVKNLWAWRGEQSPLFVFAGHTDVVPSGPIAKWSSDPFVPTQQNGMLHGRGAADMKGGVAAMLAATINFVIDYPTHRGSIGWLLTSDEEGAGTNGTPKVMATLKQRGEQIDWCVVGEPSSEKKLADQIRHGRRGSLHGKLTVIGIQGHIAYPHKADNPIHAVMPALNELCATQWDQGDQNFPPSSWQISNIHAGANANNVIPGECIIDFNFRFSPQVTSELLQQRLQAILDKHQVQYKIVWNVSAQPFITDDQAQLIAVTREAIKTITGRTTSLSTSGGTSDARFIAASGAQVIELGPLNQTIHQINECVAIDDLVELEKIYYEILKRLLIE